MNGNHDNTMIAAESLTKVYGLNTAIEDISFTCRKGEIVGFLGPNGSGKTTTMRILTGYMPPTSGAASIAGHNTLSDSIAARKRLGYLPETVPLYPEMTVEGYLAFIGRVRRVDDLWDRVDDVLEAVDLIDRAESYIGSLSKGMRQRVGLAQALIHDPDVLILDEPTAGLDPVSNEVLKDKLKNIVSEDKLVLITSHILNDLDDITTHVAYLMDGIVKFYKSLDQLKSETAESRLNRIIAQVLNKEKEYVENH